MRILIKGDEYLFASANTGVIIAKISNFQVEGDTPLLNWPSINAMGVYTSFP
ncbi:MAG: hypothetical protein V7670_05185 [Maribacter arcticus]|uniref:hypothetical protein n=1 Tax=Maribacter arcticus TaxID=561365 RepID=UPI0030033791